MTSKREIFGFCLFDFANSAYTTVIITAIYSVYFVKYIGTPFTWSLTLSLSYALTLFAAPIAGAMADFSANRKRYLFFSYALCVLATGALYFATPNFAWLAILLIVLSNLGFSLSESFVSSFLPTISNNHNIGRVSGYAWSFGYIGGVLSLLLSLLYLKSSGFCEQTLRATTVLTALFFGLSALPVFFLLKDRTLPQIKPSGVTLISIGIKRLFETYKNIKKYTELFKFLLAFFIYSCGIATVISFAAIFAEGTLGFKNDETILLLFVANITAAIGAFFFGFIQDKIGAKRTLLITLFLWVIAVLLAYSTNSKTLFWVVANIVGFAMGASQSASRSFAGLLSPSEKSGEFFGFWGVASKAASIVGLFSFGLMWKLSGGMRPAILMTLVFFISGFLLLLRVKDGSIEVKGVNNVKG